MKPRGAGEQPSAVVAAVGGGFFAPCNADELKRGKGNHRGILNLEITEQGSILASLECKMVRGFRVSPISIFFILFLLPIRASHAQYLAIIGPDREGMVEGETYAIAWVAVGLQSVSLVVHGTRTPLGNESRGGFQMKVAESISADQWEVRWTVPWIDSVEFFIKAKGYDSRGRQVAVTERGYRFRPEAMANRLENGIYLDLHSRTNQRLYVQQDHRIIHAYLSSSSENYMWRPPGSHVKVPHDHAGVFSVLEKKRVHWSSLFNVRMPWAMRYHGGHFIHATSPNLYRLLGRPASHGCNRMTGDDALQLFRMSPVGTRIEVIGPAG